ncbi:hypothetical protein CGRA01v4_05941 [Colletotrichum graminicola]|nr:hypothetical protein CGRA01v4_05941 [Colletotrichum graminicola]
MTTQRRSCGPRLRPPPPLRTSIFVSGHHPTIHIHRGGTKNGYITYTTVHAIVCFWSTATAYGYHLCLQHCAVNGRLPPNSYPYTKQRPHSISTPVILVEHALASDTNKKKATREAGLSRAGQVPVLVSNPPHRGR